MRSKANWPGLAAYPNPNPNPNPNPKPHAPSRKVDLLERRLKEHAGQHMEAQ